MATKKKAAKPALKTRCVKWYGRRADLPDPRDHLFEIEHAKLLSQRAPASVDMRSQMPPIYDQGPLGSCVGNGVGGNFEFIHHKQGRRNYKPARLFIYYNARAIEGSISSDAGCEIRDGIKAAVKLGVPHETLWPYKVAKFAAKPPARAFTDAVKHEAITYSRVKNDGDLSQLYAALAGGIPVVIGVTVADTFESAEVEKTGIVPTPQPGDNIIGGHCMLVVGYEPNPKQQTATTGIAAPVRFIVRNSWGADWGDKGYCYVSPHYLIDPDLAGDFWAISVVE